jgi:predicted amidohydrolase
MIKVASYQYTPANDIQARKAQMQNILEKAADKHIDFLCLPEVALTGYYAQEDLAHKNSLEVEGQDFQECIEVFKNFAVTVIVGFNERAGNQIFDSAAIIENGTLLGIQRKHYLYHNYFASGTSFFPITSKNITFGVVICLDTNYFEPLHAFLQCREQPYFFPLCVIKSLWIMLMQNVLHTTVSLLLERTKIVAGLSPLIGFGTTIVHQFVQAIV